MTVELTESELYMLLDVLREYRNKQIGLEGVMKRYDPVVLVPAIESARKEADLAYGVMVKLGRKQSMTALERFRMDRNSGNS